MKLNKRYEGSFIKYYLRTFFVPSKVPSYSLSNLTLYYYHVIKAPPHPDSLSVRKGEDAGGVSRNVMTWS